MCAVGFGIPENGVPRCARSSSVSFSCFLLSSSLKRNASFVCSKRKKSK